MIFFWAGDKIAQNMYKLSWYPTLDRQTWQINRANIPCGPTMSMLDRGIYTWEILPGTYPRLKDLAHLAL